MYHPKRYLHVKNWLPSTYTALELFEFMNFQFEVRGPFLAKNGYFGAVLGQYFKQLLHIGYFAGFYWNFLWNSQFRQEKPTKKSILSEKIWFLGQFCSLFIYGKYKRNADFRKYLPNFAVTQFCHTTYVFNSVKSAEKLIKKSFIYINLILWPMKTHRPPLYP